MEVAWTHTKTKINTAKQAQDCILQGHIERWHTKNTCKTTGCWHEENTFQVQLKKDKDGSTRQSGQTQVICGIWTTWQGVIKSII